MTDRRRFFAVRASIAKRAETTVTILGQRVALTDGNRELMERLRDRDAERAYEAAVFHRPHVDLFAA